VATPVGGAPRAAGAVGAGAGAGGASGAGAIGDVDGSGSPGQGAPRDGSPDVGAGGAGGVAGAPRVGRSALGIGAEPYGASASGGRCGTAGWSGRRPPGPTHLLPSQVSPSAHGGEQTDGSAGSGSAAIAAPANATITVAATEIPRRIPRMIHLDIRPAQPAHRISAAPDCCAPNTGRDGGRGASKHDGRHVSGGL